jgi:peptidoglycan/xylan/chitin deacetylase (PgdA/CDA1 family)
MQACITIDVEHDCPPYLTSYRGIEEGLPRLLDLLMEESVVATFFATGDVARRFPTTIRRILDEGHELGCHGDTHRRFSALGPTEAKAEIDAATETLRKFGPCTSFRAPNLDFPRSYIPFLRDAGYKLDSSEGRHKPGSFFVEPYMQDGVKRVAASTAPSLVRLPAPIREAAFRMMRGPVVLFFHPWEFTDFTRDPIPLDCRFRTGQPALDTLRASIRFFRGRGATFQRMDSLEAAPAARRAAA